MSFSRRFPHIDGLSLSPKVGNMQFFQELHLHIDRNSGEKFEDMFLVKLASKGTSLNQMKPNRTGGGGGGGAVSLLGFLNSVPKCTAVGGRLCLGDRLQNFSSRELF